MRILGYLVPIGMTYFDGHVNIDSLINDLLVMEDHIKNGANKNSNRVRATLIRARIQTAIADMATSVGQVSYFISSDYLDLISVLMNENDPMIDRMVSSVHASSTLRQVFKQFEQYKKLLTQDNFGNTFQLFKAAANKESHIVMMLDVYPTDINVEVEDRDYQTQFLNRHSDEDVITKVSKKQGHEVRIRSVFDAISDVVSGQPTSLSLGDWRHSDITETLWQGVYVDTPQNAVLVPIIYSDGSQARPFPFECLQLRNLSAAAALTAKRPLKMGLMSGRHPEMDNVVSGYWLQNIEISQHKKTLAEADEASYQRSKVRFAQLRGSSWHLWFVQTGYPPAVVGFLRALVEEMVERANEGVWLYLVPQYYDWDRKSQQMVYKPGTPWF